MNGLKNKLLSFFALIVTIASLQLDCSPHERMSRQERKDRQAELSARLDELRNEAENLNNQILDDELETSHDSAVFQDNFNKVMQKKADYYQSEEGIEKVIDALGNGVSTVISTIAMVALLTYVQAKMMGGNNDGRMQIYYPGQIKVKFADVAGLAGAKAEMKDIIAYLKNSKKYKALGARVPKGVLMNGGPGNGKTLLAKAFAGEVNVPFISINGSSFVQMFVGMGAARVRELFKKARDLAWWYGGCIIFIDEIDSLAMQRGNNNYGGSEYDQTLNALLAEMDGLDSSGSPVIVLGATNRIGMIDEAVKRPGRFDRKVEVSKPNIKDRIELLTIAFAKLKESNSVDIERVALATRGCSGAELANLVNEAAILAVNAGHKKIEDSDIELAFDNITLGREIMGMAQSDEAKRETAIHEAGHTMALIILDKKHRVHKSSITPRSNTLGVMRLLPLYESYSLTKHDMINDIIICLSGRLAEEEFGLVNSTGAYSDLQRAHSMAYDIVAVYGMSHALHNISYSQRGQLPNDIATQVEREIQKIIDECTKKGQEIMKKHRADIEKIANLMMQKGTVLGEEIYNLLNMPVPKMQQEETSENVAVSAA